MFERQFMSKWKCEERGTSGGHVQGRLNDMWSISGNNGTSEVNVQGHTRGSASKAHVSKDTHYLLQDQPKKGKVKQGNNIKRKRSARKNKTAAKAQALSVDKALKMLKDDFDRREQRALRRKLPKPARRSTCLARNRKRTGHWRNDVRQWKEVEEATRRSEGEINAEQNSSGGGARNNRRTESVRGSSADKRAKERMRKKMRPDDRVKSLTLLTQPN